ncbi:hypothetical protein CC2G_009852 [Coprinopsis cinerea AmutBmut pab1-1]|nr:hypothetical protein CC2G_009852 [Coprinopsis cinerea AmutBmut pab1-1]
MHFACMMSTSHGAWRWHASTADVAVAPTSTYLCEALGIAANAPHCLAVPNIVFEPRASNEGEQNSTPGTLD